MLSFAKLTEDFINEQKTPLTNGKNRSFLNFNPIPAEVLENQDTLGGGQFELELDRLLVPALVTPGKY